MIGALNIEQSPNYVPYRNCKLTRLLMHAFKSNTKFLMFGTISSIQQISVPLLPTCHQLSEPLCLLQELCQPKSTISQWKTQNKAVVNIKKLKKNQNKTRKILDRDLIFLHKANKNKNRKQVPLRNLINLQPLRAVKNTQI